MIEDPDETFRYEAVPMAAIRLFRMSWQLESWLRQIVYVELRAARKEWAESLTKHLRRWPPKSVENDKRLHHMTTAHQEGLSYLTFGELWQVISATENWDFFAAYFPPKENVQARIDEVKTIRNRVAHCREPHENDERRLELFLRDIDPGLRRFCLRYTQPVRSYKDDPVANELASNWVHYGYSTEMFSTDLGWIYAPEPLKGRPRLGARLGRLCRPLDSTSSQEGTIYKLDLFGLANQYLHVAEVVEGAAAHRNELLHVIVCDAQKVQVTLPAVLGTAQVVEVLAHFLQIAQNALSGRVDNLARILGRSWPECVLVPNDPLTTFVEEYEGPLFDL